MRSSFTNHELIWILYILTAAVVSGAILYGYHDHFWHSRDEGYFAHAAERLLAGEVLHRDIGTQHTGIIHFLHAFSFWLFGLDLASLRVFPAVTTWVQAGLVFFLMKDRGPATALAGAIAFSAATFPLFPSPTQNWTSLFLVIVLITLVVRWPGLSWRKLVVMGMICGLVFGLRQPTGVFLSMAITVICYFDYGSKEAELSVVSRWVGPLFLSIFAVILGYYIAGNFDLVSTILFGWVPLMVLILAISKIKISNKNALIVAGFLCLGAVLALSPLVLYHIFHGSLGHWIENTIGGALYLASLDYVGAGTYASQIIGGPVAGLETGSLAAVIAGLLWPLVLLMAPVVGYGLLRQFWSHQTLSSDLKILIILVFVFLVAGHHPDRVYFAYALAPILLGLLILAQPKYQTAVSVLVAFSACAMLYFHGAQPYERGHRGDLIGMRVSTTTPLGVERASLYVSNWEAAHHQQMVQLIQNNSDPDDPILALPGNADLFFLAGRPNPLSAVMPVYSLIDDRTLDEAFARLRASPPQVVVHVPHLPYNTEWTDKVMAAVLCDYEQVAEIAGFNFYLPTTDAPFQNIDKCSVPVAGLAARKSGQYQD